MSSTAAAQKTFSFEQKSDRLTITHSGQPLTDFVFHDTNTLRPYFTAVRTLDDIQVTRNHPPIAGTDAVDHPTMHPGIWLAFGDISGQDFWRNKAVIRHDKFIEPPAIHDNKLSFATESTLVSTNNEEIAKMISHFAISSVNDGWLLSWSATFSPLIENLTFGDQEEMGFGVRVATPITEKNGGSVLNSDGVKSARAAWGKTANWCDYSGVLSNRLVGITVMADPKNFRPSWFHSRDYGLLEANPFGRKAFTKGEPSSIPVPKGKSLQIRFGAFIHSSDTNVAPAISAAYEHFTSKP